MKHTQHSKISQEQYKYPFETYTGLQEAQSQRIKQFEAETKAMIHRSVEQSSSRTSIDEQTNSKLLYSLYLLDYFKKRLKFGVFYCPLLNGQRERER